MELILPIIVVLALVVLAWKLLKGLAKTAVLIGILILAVLYVSGAFN